MPSRRSSPKNCSASLRSGSGSRTTTGAPLLANVRCVGGLLAGHDPTVEGSREGVALATAARVAALLANTPAR